MVSPIGTFRGHDILAVDVNTAVHPHRFGKVVSPCSDLAHDLGISDVEGVGTRCHEKQDIAVVLLEQFMFLVPEEFRDE